MGRVECVEVSWCKWDGCLLFKLRARTRRELVGKVDWGGEQEGKRGLCGCRDDGCMWTAYVVECVGSAMSEMHT